MGNIAHLFHFSLAEMRAMSLFEITDWNARAIRFSEAGNETA